MKIIAHEKRASSHQNQYRARQSSYRGSFCFRPQLLARHTDLRLFGTAKTKHELHYDESHSRCVTWRTYKAAFQCEISTNVKGSQAANENAAAAAT